MLSTGVLFFLSYYPAFVPCISFNGSKWQQEEMRNSRGSTHFTVEGKIGNWWSQKVAENPNSSSVCCGRRSLEWHREPGLVFGHDLRSKIRVRITSAHCQNKPPETDWWFVVCLHYCSLCCPVDTHWIFVQSVWNVKNWSQKIWGQSARTYNKEAICLSCSSSDSLYNTPLGLFLFVTELL